MVKVQNLSYRIGKKNIVDNVSFDLVSGDFLSVIGPNGAGKTTLLKTIAIFNRLETLGDVFYKDVSYQNYTIEQLATIRSFCTQKNELSFAFKVKEVINFGQYGKQLIDEKAFNKVISLLNIEAFIDRDINTLSGGEQQKVHIARALVQLLPDIENKVLLLDEPLTYLDHKYQKEIMALLSELCKAGLTIISVLHDVNIASRFSNKTLMLKNGRLQVFGETKRVLNQENLSNLFDTDMESFVDDKGITFFV